mmetsp:Transcript_31074/g.68996  ORF Transcript_31074/g.68996 Transcript_31074/m.68996 type:complete len:291 (+) Transcript_31074:1183-2055(+)
MESVLKGRSSLWYSVPPHTPLSCAPLASSASLTLDSTAMSSYVTSQCMCTAPAPTSATRAGSTSSGRPTLTTRSEPRERSCSLRSCTLSRMKRARFGPVLSNPEGLLPYSRGSKQYTGSTEVDCAAATARASLSCRRRSLRNQTMAGLRPPPPLLRRPRDGGAGIILGMALKPSSATAPTAMERFSRERGIRLKRLLANCPFLVAGVLSGVCFAKAVCAPAWASVLDLGRTYFEALVGPFNPCATLQSALLMRPGTTLVYRFMAAKAVLFFASSASQPGFEVPESCILFR